jgi:hypothetical protein
MQAGTPRTWIQISPAAVTADPTTGTIPVGYWVWNVTTGHLKRHAGGYFQKRLRRSVSTFGGSAERRGISPVKSNMKTTSVITLVLAAWLSSCAHSPTATPDLSTPEATVIGFTKAAAQGNADLAQRHFLPGGTDYLDIRETLQAQPGTPMYPARRMLEAVDVSQPITVTQQTGNEQGLKVVWRVTFGKAFEEKGRRVEAGSQYEFDATLKRTAKGWLIDNF